MDIYVIVTAVMILAAFVLMVPSGWLRKFAGYQLISDVLLSAYVINTYAVIGSVSGMTTGIIAAVLISVTIRAIRYFWGFDRYEINGEDRVALVAAKILEQAAHWIKSFFMAIFRKGKIVPPEPLGGNWVRHGSGFKGHIDAMENAIAI